MNRYSTLGLLRHTVESWHTRNVTRLAGTLAYYAASAIMAMVLIIALLISTVFNSEAIGTRIMQGAQVVVGADTAELLRSAISNVSLDIGGSSLLTTVGSVIVMIYTCSRLFLRLQDALDVLWDVERPQQVKVKRILKDALVSLATALVFGFIILLILLLNGAAFATINYLDRLLPGNEHLRLYQAGGFVLLFVLLLMVFIFIFRYLPHTRLAWRSIIIGAALTSILLMCGQLLLGQYIEISNTETLYGTAGTLVVLLVWVYVCAHIVLFGATFTYLHANQHKLEALSSNRVDHRSSSQVAQN